MAAAPDVTAAAHVSRCATAASTSRASSFFGSNQSGSFRFHMNVEYAIAR